MPGRDGISPASGGSVDRFPSHLRRRSAGIRRRDYVLVSGLERIPCIVGHQIRLAVEITNAHTANGRHILTVSRLMSAFRLANCMSMVTLTIAAAMFTQYWESSFGITAATFILLLALFLMNACGVELYGRMGM
ncbi:MAG: hypothetical protein Q9226_007537 [Calogaya cf. arnoldii]